MPCAADQEQPHVVTKDLSHFFNSLLRVLGSIGFLASGASTILFLTFLDSLPDKRICSLTVFNLWLAL